MAIKKSNPTSAGQRFRSVASFEEITSKTPENPFLKKRRRLVAVTLTEESLLVTLVVETVKNIV